MKREVENSEKKKKYVEKLGGSNQKDNGSILWMFSRKGAHVEFHTPNIHSKEKGLLNATF